MKQGDIDLLQTVPLSHLLTLARVRQSPLLEKLLEITDPHALPSELLEQLAGQLFDASELRSLLQGLSQLERLILDELDACGGRANSRDLALYLSASGQLKRPAGREVAPDSVSRSFLRAFGDYESWQTSEWGLQYPAPHPHGLFEQALHHLLQRGLLFWGKQPHFAGRDYSAGTYDGVLIIPPGVREVLCTLRDEMAEQTGPPTSPEREELSEEIRTFQRMLYLYWSLVAGLREGLALVSTGLLARPALRQVNEHFNIYFPQSDQLRGESESPHLLFIRLLLLELGLLRIRGNSVYAATADAFFSLPLLERARRCYRAWLESTFWNEIGAIPDVIVRPAPTPLEPAHEETVRARRSVVEQIVRLAASGDQELPAFIARLKLRVPYLLFPRHYGPREERYSVGSNPYGRDFRLRRGWLTHREGWYLVEGGFIRAVMSGPLRWQGLVSVQEEGQGGKFRLTAGATAVMGAVDLAPEDVEPVWGRLVIQPNFEMIALAPVSESLLVQLDHFAERISLERIAQYRLTRASVMRAIQRGMRAEEMEALLSQAADSPLPQNVQYSLTEWERQARRVELWRSAVLLEVADAPLLDQLLADAEIAPLLGRRLTPVTIMVSASQMPRLRELLWQRGYLPAFSTAPQEERSECVLSGPVEPQWRLHLSGHLEPLHAVTDLYLTARLERMTDFDEACGQRVLTQAALQRALAGGLSLEAILCFLQRYCEEGIPPALVIRLKLWGRGYGEQGNVRVEDLPVLSLAAEALQDLRADSELASLLGPEVEPERRLVHVERQHLERVLQLLRERGFDVE
jgi:hypothetical protein